MNVRSKVLLMQKTKVEVEEGAFATFDEAEGPRPSIVRWLPVREDDCSGQQDIVPLCIQVTTLDNALWVHCHNTTVDIVPRKGIPALGAVAVSVPSRTSDRCEVSSSTILDGSPGAAVDPNSDSPQTLFSNALSQRLIRELQKRGDTGRSVTVCCGISDATSGLSPEEQHVGASVGVDRAVSGLDGVEFGAAVLSAVLELL